MSILLQFDEVPHSELTYGDFDVVSIPGTMPAVSQVLGEDFYQHRVKLKVTPSQWNRRGQLINLHKGPKGGRQVTYEKGFQTITDYAKSLYYVMNNVPEGWYFVEGDFIPMPGFPKIFRTHNVLFSFREGLLHCKDFVWVGRLVKSNKRYRTGLVLRSETDAILIASMNAIGYDDP